MSQQESSLAVKVITGASKTQISGFMADGALKIKLNAKPIEGKANLELIELLGDKLNLPKDNLSIIRGEHSRRKVLKISGLDQAQLKRRLENLLDR